MFKYFRFTIIALSFVVTLPSLAARLPQITSTNPLQHGGNSLTAKTSPDSTYQMGPWGSGASVNGQFETPDGSPAWNGWTHLDHTRPTTDNQWHVSNYNADSLNDTPDNLAMYCGDETIPACSDNDVEGGYSNGLRSFLRFNYTVTDPNESCDVTISGVFNHNTEPGYDFTIFVFENAGGNIVMDYFDGADTAVPFSYGITYSPEDYLGDDHNQIQFDIRVDSDWAYSDADCLYFGNGACQVDDLRVQCSNGNYDNTSDFQDGPGDDWILAYPLGTGDFTDLWAGLHDLDPCKSNYSPQVAFIDDGTIVPGVGPSYCISWCYGPGGYILNVTGGAQEGTNPEAFLRNEILSPVIPLPENEEHGTLFSFDVYRHFEYSQTSAPVYYYWGIRSAVDLSELENSEWQSRNFLYAGGPNYQRHSEPISDLLQPGATVAQVKLGCWEVRNYTWSGDDATPAPYFDNASLITFPIHGPALVAREMDLAQDNFPESGLIDMDNLASMNVRFDRAQFTGDLESNIPGDSLICTVATARSGGVLTSNRLYYSMQRNPVFNSVRDPNWGASGFVDAQPALDENGVPEANQFAYDLPDSGFLYPGDVLHFYISATDEVDGANPQTTTLPADLFGFGDFSDMRFYNSLYKVHCLPSLDANGSQPELLFWNDFGSDGDIDEWFRTLYYIGFIPGVHYDYYSTTAASSGSGSGLGSRATVGLVTGYNGFIYSCGTLENGTLSSGGDWFGPSPDVQLLTDWFSQTQVDAFFCGDNLVHDLSRPDPDANAFLNDYLNVTEVSENIRPLINNQLVPLVTKTPGNPVFYQISNWFADSSCDDLNKFDAVTTGPGAERLARFTDPGESPAYEYSAATLNHFEDDQIISIPYDLMSVQTNFEGGYNGHSTRILLLAAILNFFGLPWDLQPTDVPEAEVFSVRNHPNPFNPSTRIEFNLPKAAHLGVKVFNIRGELVKSLMDEQRLAGVGFVDWDGTNQQGGSVSSGVYFYEVRFGSEVEIGKMALIK